ncbi:MAG: S-layer homology domain-containing protein [Candidatus Cohnella colombiensis]|uniref:S-layer homology domain-containing protein n=1 Tax=Candidatus Cohnella colombiensis TaxID=3121368 RepID=A0AA95JCW3_9BACL|nr:MAG: S-layer homology domain-containing protein [Cohnella sp.]
MISEGNAVKNRGYMKLWLSMLLVMAVLLQGVLGAGATIVNAAEDEASVTAVTREQIVASLAELQKVVGKSQPLSDWAAFGLARSGVAVEAQYMPIATASVADGSLRLSTDFARVALTVNAVGGDAQKIGLAKSNLPEKLANFEKLTAQGPNAVAYALIALDATGYEIRESDYWTKDALIKWLVDNRNADAGWSLKIGAGKSDVDITGIVLSALAPYQNREDVRGIVDAALEWLSNAQKETGGFGSPEASESTAQVLIALTALGIDPINDARFVKNGNSAISRLLSFRLADGQYSHVVGGKADGMATLYALLGVTAVDRWQDGLPSLFAGVNIGVSSAVTVNGLSGTIATGVASGKTALEAFANVLKAAKISYEVTVHPQYGAFLSSVNGLSSGKFGGYDGWSYAVKRDGAWVTIMEGMGSFSMQSGDELFVYYGDSTELIHSFVTEPAAPRAGQPIVVVVQKEAYDWDTGSVVVSAAANAAVKLGGQTVVTDADGKATFKGVAAGSYSVSVSGYAKDRAPTYLAATSSIEVASYIKNVALRVEGDAGVIASGATSGGTALEALEKLLAAQGVNADIQDSSYGKYIAAIAGISGGKYGGYDGWMFAVIRKGEWIIPAEGASTFLLEDGDEVVVYYSGEATKLVEPVIVSPAKPKPNQAFVVKVTHREWDWSTSQFKAAEPVAGATVTVRLQGKKGTNVQTGVTDAKGNVTFVAATEGIYDIEVSGYQKEGVPAVVRSVKQLVVANAYNDAAAISTWAIDAVQKTRAGAVWLGPNETKAQFKPKQAATRAEFVSALVRALGLNNGSATAGKNSFSDVKDSAWYAADLNVAVTAGLVAGVAPGKFAPDATLTREQAAILLTRALKLKATKTTALKDAGQASTSAKSSIQAVISHGWMTAYGERFSPKASLTREQVAVIASRIMDAR